MSDFFVVTTEYEIYEQILRQTIDGTLEWENWANLMWNTTLYSSGSYIKDNKENVTVNNFLSLLSDDLKEWTTSYLPFGP